MFVADTRRRRRHVPRVLGSADLLTAIHTLRDEGRLTNAELGRLLELPSPRIVEIFDGRRKITVDEAKLIIDRFDLLERTRGSESALANPAEALDMVGIAQADIEWGLGSTFAVDYPEVDVLMFPKQWIETITHSPPEMLVWTRGRGDSMEPTIRNGDLVLLDRSKNRLDERDAMWALTIGEEAMIKRLRRQGDRVELLSDNANVPTDEQNLRDVHIVGRVVFVGSRK